ncbi:hypothetical protein BGX28_002239 [Mortierella sp. GBA30]|nr:hypothetical protein BGX28_002239 [Mortierella sp. GBA30]
MSAANVPEGLKSITPFLQRAAQLQDRDPVVSYYSNHYAAKLAIPKMGKEAANRLFIEELLNVLEKQKKDIGDNEAISNDLVGYAHIENFALKIFKRADDEDRTGQGSQKTAKNFVAAANFLEVLKVFGDIDSEVEEKIKYSKWRAAEIVKAIRDGRQPAPPPGSDITAKTEESVPGMDMEMRGAESLETLSGVSASDASNIGGTTFSPAFVAPPIPPTVQQPGASASAAPSFPTISNFPSPPLGPTTATSNLNNNTFNGAINSPSASIGWSQPPVSPNMNMGDQQHLYSTGVTPPIHQQQQFQQPPPPSTYVPPAVPSPTPSSVYMPNPMSPPVSNSAQYGYGMNNNIDNSNQYQAPVVPGPAPAQPPFSQAGPGFNSPSAPYHQQQPIQQPLQSPAPPTQSPYMPVPMVLDPAINSQVQKHCKWTVSALTYDDIPTAIENLEKALALLRPYHNK